MKLAHKMVISFFIVALLIWVIGSFALNISEKALKKTFIRANESFALGILSELDKNIHDKIELFEVYSRNFLLQEKIMESILEFEKMDDIQAYIDKKDMEWRSAPKDEITPFMRSLMTNELSREIQGKLDFYEGHYGYSLFPEVIITNKYGVNVAQTGRTSDYRQGDEEWWQTSKKAGLYVRDLAYDESAEVFSTDIGVRVNDGKGNFLGVIKVVMSVKDVMDILKQARYSGMHKEHISMEISLMTKEGLLIYSTEENGQRQLTDVSYLLPGAEHPDHVSGNSTAGSYIKHLKEEDDGLLVTHAHSQGYHSYKGLGWILVLTHRESEIFGPVTNLRKYIMSTSLAVTLIGILIGYLFSASVNKKMQELIRVTGRIGSGDLDARFEAGSKDEIAQLGGAINSMSDNLLKTTVSKEKFKKQNEFLSTIVESIPHPFYVVDVKDYSIKLANSATEALGDWRNANCYTITHKSDTPCSEDSHACPLNIVRNTKKPAITEHIHYDSNGEERIFEVNGYPVFDETGNVVQMIEYSVDITDRKKAEHDLKSINKKLEQSNRELQDFVYIASHDLQEPLRKISSFGDRLKAKTEGTLGKQEQNYLARMLNASGRMQQLINGLLTFSRITTRGGTPGPVDLNQIVLGVLSDLEVAIERSGGRVEAGGLSVIEADPLQMRQLFQNLVGNALKFRSGEPSPVVKIYGGFTNGNGSFNRKSYRFTVEDNGIGMDEKHSERIFGIFQRLHGRSEYDGTGIGLSICRKIVERHGGNISVKSKPGAGSKFIVTLPAEQRETRNEHKERLSI